ncbi:hypothetical protein OG474_22630 [Kribbella sp. NBC_01505]|uniref:hypothetical protein n=1 Tax=Kribbella sp. NBC_01505 TaxID=2903580 RepID=UPI00386CA035
MGDADVRSDSDDDPGDGWEADEAAYDTDWPELEDEGIAGDHWIAQPRIEITIGWLVGLVAYSLGFLLAIVSLTLPWTFVYPRPGQQVVPGMPETPFLTRISNYEPASVVTVLVVIGFALVVAACFGTVGLANRALRVLTPVAGIFIAWFVGVLYVVVLRSVNYGYSREFGQSVQFDRNIYTTEPSTGLALCCLGILMMAAGSVVAVRPQSHHQPAVASAQLHRVGYLCAGIALVMLVSSLSEPWLRHPSDPMSVDPVWGGPPRLDSWLAAFRFTTIAALIFLTVLMLSKSVRIRRWLTGAGLVTCTVTATILLAGRLLAWFPDVEVEVRPTYYLAIGAAVLLTVAFLDSALGDVVSRLREDAPA